MKYFSSVVPVCIFALVLLFGAKTVQAQNIFNSSGDVKSTKQYYADKAAAEAAAKRNAVPASSRPATTSSTPSSGRRQLTSEEKAAINREMDKAVEEDNARRKREAENKITEDKRKAAFSSASGKYMEVTATSGSYGLSRVKLNGKYGYINSWGTEVIPLVYDNAGESFDHERALVRSGKKWGFIDFKGTVVIPAKYDDAKDFKDGSATVKLGNKWGLVDPQDKLLIPIKYDDAIIFDAAFEFAPVSIDGKYGCIDVLGQVRIPMVYEALKKPSYGLLGAKQNGKWGFLDKKGDVAIAFQFDDIISGFGVSTAIVTKGNAKFAINTGGVVSGSKTNITTGETITEVQVKGTFTDKRENKTYNTIKIGEQVWMSQNLDVVKFGYGEEIPEANSKKEWDRANKDHKAAWCYYDNDPANGEKYGKLYNWWAAIDARRIAPAGWHIPSIEEWTILITTMGGFKFAGNSMKKTVWAYGEYPTNPSGFAAVPAGMRLSDKDATFLSATFGTGWWSRNESSPTYAKSIELSAEDNLRESIYINEGQGMSIRCIQDKNTPVVVTPSAISPVTTTEEVKPAEKAGLDISLRPTQVKKKFGYMDESGTMVIKALYDYASFFNDGLAAVKIGKKWGVIDGTGNMVIPTEYDLILNFEKGMARVTLNDKDGFIDKKNQVVIPIIYDDAAWHSAEGCIAVLLNGKWGFVDTKNNTIIPFLYESVYDFSDGLAGVQLGGKWGFIDRTGKVIIPIKYEAVGSFSNGIGTVYTATGSRKVDKEGKEK